MENIKLTPKSLGRKEEKNKMEYEYIKDRRDGKDILIAVPRADAEAVRRLNLDANETAFLMKELQYIKAKTYDTKFELIKYTQLLPIATDVPETAEQVQWDSYTDVGMAAVIADYAQNAPRVDTYKTANYANIRRIGDSFGYDRTELQRGATTNARLSTRMPEAARRAVEQKFNAVAWVGDSAFKLQGLINYPGILEYTVPATGTGTTKTFSTKTPDQIITDVTGMISTIMKATGGVEMPDTWLLPLSQYLDLLNRRLSDTDTNLLTYILEKIPMIKKVDWLVELAGAGTGSTDRMMMYQNSPEKLEYQLVKPYTQLPPVQKGYGYEVATEAFTGGVTVYYPLSVAFGDGI